MRSRAAFRLLRRTSIATLLLLAVSVAPARAQAPTQIPAVHATANAAADAAATSQAHRFEIPVREHVFDNGLRLLVLERPGDERVACKIFTDFGGYNETPGDAGSAHYLEHLMFKGTKTLGTNDWEAEAPLVEDIRQTERQLTEALNAARNDTRQRGVFHDYQHAASSPEIDELRAELVRLNADAAEFRDGGAMMRWYQAYGGTGLTATTEQEYMKFDINLPVARIDLFLRVEADRMVNSIFREFDQERMILVEQRLGDLNQPTTPYAEQMTAASGMMHPVYWPEGFYPTDFQQYTRHYQRDLYERYFVVNNTTLVFVGGVSLEEMIPKVEHYFGWMETAPEPMRVKAIEPVPAAERRLVYRSDELEPRVEVRYMIPAVGHPDRPHFDVLAELASTAIGTALETAGVEGRVNVNTRVVHTSRFGVPSTMNFEVVVNHQDDLAAAESALHAALNALAAGISRTRGAAEATGAGAAQATAPDRIALAKKKLRTEWYRTAASADALAFEIGHFQTMDRWQTLEEFLNAREATTAQDIARLAERYFIPENRTVGVVIAADDGGRQ